ncbi:polysaccharide deacetylase family protein [Shimazuella sp. AN120528]|uniref:polysaccharide deacetylase family protein n=1 Tax=Shimazuella soli TaxID=1892854 RepID=UPI001F0EC3BA|nr:polysaccharide deacetylase family protein [Shimazuella soli]MCH5586260.1 polysaccharide deacetylase family protein [Shimazuella soli]
MKKNYYIIGVLTLMVVTIICYHSPVFIYISAIRNQTAIPTFLSDDTGLEAKIDQEASKHEKAPINARNDRVWKLVPGLDGFIVDKEKTYEKTKQLHSKDIQWVYKAVKPAVDLKDLGTGPIFKGNEQQQAVALMVNVAWGTEYLPKMLQIFQQEKIKVTFFLDGTWLNSHRKEGLALEKAGHEIGNHGYTHQMMSQVPIDRMNREIGRTEEVIKQVFHHPSKWFAPPSGDFNNKVVQVASDYHLGTVLWTLDTIDWRKTTSATSMVQKIGSKVEPGNLILMHPTDRTVQALPGMIRAIKQKKLALATVSEVLSTKRLNIR